MSDYNGWTNRATWLVNVWYDPQSKEELEAVKRDIEESFDALCNGLLKDMIDLYEINWEELAEFYKEEDDV